MDRQLLDACRHDSPICERPFAEIAQRLDDRDGEVLRRFEELERRGVSTGSVRCPRRYPSVRA
ncbi:MAG: Lrp/AsnC family transcriptional regulator, partial [Gammaproteobacteria bacterium]|nr:Lrp/AsnC family transcriptional regulator [Gammaproteobacteria bacterium]